MKKKNGLIGLALLVILVFLTAPVQPSLSAGEGESNGIGASALSGQFHLDHQVKIYVPSTVNGSTPIPKEVHDQYVDQALEKFSGWFGGATAVDGQGAWVDDSQKLIKENVTIVYAFAEKLDKTAINQVVDYAEAMKKELSQSAISLEVDGRMYFIE
ncbi:DUF3574 domain-containing protein [Paenibacillus aurantius]|uniref:DUF3574 domain-containing protein n=1 Tax=Paenibacillus aurantius TaxID=2918900 RepID=A0AA96RE10_9BACL|nr:DUF3574 domain-containing protein [Paenibacillus aurantius]WNQ11935.1 DUF3574 domain-containing protein [Paenibacillus aurantius]